MKEHELIESKARRLTWWGLNTEIDRIKAALAGPDTKQLGRWKKRLAIMEAQLANRIKPGCRPAGGFTLLELLCVIAVITVLLAMAVPSVVRAYRACAARTAWTEYWHNVQLTAMANDQLPPVMDPYLVSPDDAWRQTYQMLGSSERYADVSWETIRMIRTSTQLLAGRPATGAVK